MQRQKPVNGAIQSRGEALAIASHPAMRLGFLDAQRGLPLDHDAIMQRIEAETPPRAIERIGWTITLRYPSSDDVRVAQYRYEEGRLLVLDAGLRCRAWGHPDFPPAQVRDWIEKRFPVEAPKPLPDNVLELWKAAARAA